MGHRDLVPDGNSMLEGAGGEFVTNGHSPSQPVADGTRFVNSFAGRNSRHTGPTGLKNCNGSREAPPEDSRA